RPCPISAHAIPFDAVELSAVNHVPQSHTEERLVPAADARAGARGSPHGADLYPVTELSATAGVAGCAFSWSFDAFGVGSSGTEWGRWVEGAPAGQSGCSRCRIRPSRRC